jgi:gluconokinase
MNDNDDVSLLGTLPILIVAMGVSGSGKSSVARALADRLALRYLEGDDYHSDEARSRMAKAIPLLEEMRMPWIAAICRHLKQLANEGEDCVLAFSGLKKAHREPLRHTGFKVIFLFLEGDKATIRQRMQDRKGHFMPPQLLDSQFDTLEPPLDEADVLRLDIRQPLQQIVEQAMALINQYRTT